MKNKEKIKRMYIIGIIIIVVIVFLILLTQNTTVKNMYNGNGSKKIETFLENNNDSTEKIVMNEKELIKKKEELLQITDTMNNYKMNNSPNTINYNNNSYYLYNDSLLMPLNSNDWVQYDIDNNEQNIFVSEFYLKEESPKNWTQKMTIHKINTINHDQANSFEIVDKIINGLIINISDQATIDGEELTKDNISFNYVKKEKDNTIVFWSTNNIKNRENEIQFVRVFLSTYSKQTYLVTCTIKQDQKNISDDEIKYYLKVINSVQELRKK